jgi:hypothetical protein
LSCSLCYARKVLSLKIGVVHEIDESAMGDGVVGGVDAGSV